ncbi:hypothetical protein Barb4_01549 [Bacteroidales bacterium Barb4]|nr:hypothetical protein Barb4_01549 [Bacteroidales bacterium Barb4]
MQRSEMWGYKDDIANGVLKERYKYKRYLQYSI